MGFRNTAKTVDLLGGIGGVLVLVGAAVGGAGGALIGAILGLVGVGAAYWFADGVAVRAAGADPAPGTGDDALTDPGRAALDSYAEQLTTEAARLAAYREELRRVAEELSRGEDADTSVVRRIADETRPPVGSVPPSSPERDAATYSS